jgi:acyl-CoA thioesterase I
VTTSFDDRSSGITCSPSHRIFPSLAQEHDFALVPFLLAGVALNPEMNGDDMIHPNAAGARHIATTVWPYLEALIRTS